MNQNKCPFGRVFFFFSFYWSICIVQNTENTYYIYQILEIQVWHSPLLQVRLMLILDIQGVRSAKRDTMKMYNRCNCLIQKKKITIISSTR